MKTKAKREATVLFRVTARERATLARAARKRNMTLSEYIRWVLLSQADAA